MTGQRDACDAGPPRHARLAHLFTLVRDLPEGRRAELLREHCPDEGLRQEVEQLLAFHARDWSPVDRAVVPPTIDDALTPVARDAVPGYRILRLLGEGGMGVVYLAEDRQRGRTVALKLLRLSATNPDTLARFEREAKALARLHHPGIAAIHEVGTAPIFPGSQRRRPYFAMEFVDGRPIHKFVQERRLSAPQRVALIAEVCSAVHHAHERGVIHRDLKPWNILVTGGEERFWPIVLDFGVARLVEEEGAAQGTGGLPGEKGPIVGTLHWMSPEQLDGEDVVVDARTDVFALGVILYELLAGAPPLVLAGVPIAEALRRVREVEPPPLGEHRPELCGRLEAVIAKAIAKDRARRYATAAELRRDLLQAVDDVSMPDPRAG